MISDLIQRFKHKNYLPVVLLINKTLYFFPNSWVEENLTQSSSVQHSWQENEQMLILSTERCISLSIRIPMDQILHKAYYNICKQVIRAATQSCVTTQAYRQKEEIQESEKITIVDALSYKFPIKQGKSESSGLRSGMNIDSSLNENPEKVSIHQKAQAINDQAENSYSSGKRSKPKIHFSDVQLPKWLPICCGFFGYSVQSLACILTSFTLKSEPDNSQEIWNITLTEFQSNYQKETLANPVELEETPIDIIPSYPNFQAVKSTNVFDKIAKPFF